MKHTFEDALKERRTYYRIGNTPLLGDEDLQKLVETTVLHVPSAFNSQSTRIVLLLREQHKRLWEIVKETLKPLVPEKAFEASCRKIDGSFASGQGTVLFFEDQRVVKQLQERFPLYRDSFPVYSEHTSAMHQFVLWTLLEEAGYGASLQHYNPLIDEAVVREWKLDSEWKLVAQMPFGSREGEPDGKTFQPLEERIKVFK